VQVKKPSRFLESLLMVSNCDTANPVESAGKETSGNGGLFPDF